MAVGTTIALGLAGAQLLGSVLGRKPKTPTLLSPPTAPPDPAIANRVAGEQAATDQRKRAATADGRASTILTSPAGLPTAAPTQRKTLLGS